MTSHTLVFTFYCTSALRNTLKNQISRLTANRRSSPAFPPSPTSSRCAAPESGAETCAGPRTPLSAIRFRKLRNSRPQHLRRDLSRFGRQLRRRDPLIVDADQAVGERVIERPVAVECASADYALRELRQKPHQPRHPQLKVGERHPQLGPRISCRTARLNRNTASLASRSGINSSSNSPTCARRRRSRITDFAWPSATRSLHRNRAAPTPAARGRRKTPAHR